MNSRQIIRRAAQFLLGISILMSVVQDAYYGFRYTYYISIMDIIIPSLLLILVCFDKRIIIKLIIVVFVTFSLYLWYESDSKNSNINRAFFMESFRFFNSKNYFMAILAAINILFYLLLLFVNGFQIIRKLRSRHNATS
jgi:hypothetical protein